MCTQQQEIIFVKRMTVWELTKVENICAHIATINILLADVISLSDWLDCSPATPLITKADAG